MEGRNIRDIFKKQSSSKKPKLEENVAMKFEDARTMNDPLEYDMDSSLVTYCEGNSDGYQQDDLKLNEADFYENIRSKDEILREAIYNIVVEKHVSKDVIEAILKVLSNYGAKVPLSKAALIAEFQKINEATLAQQYADLKQQMNKMEATLDQLKHAVLTAKGSMHEIRVSIPVQNEMDLELLEKQCSENDLAANFVKFRYLSDIIDDNILLKFNWDGVQGKKKLSEYTNLHQTLYSAFENDTISDFPSYRNFVKAELRRIHNKHHQKESRKRRSKIISNSEEIVQFSEIVLN